MALFSRLQQVASQRAMGSRVRKRLARVERAPLHTFAHYAEAIAKLHAHQPALIGVEGSISFAQWNIRSNRIARFARSQGWRPGEAVALWMANGADQICLWTGLAKVGCVSALMDVSMHDRDVARALAMIEARALIVDSAMALRLASFADDIPARLEIFVTGPAVQYETVKVAGLPLLLAGFSTADLPHAERPELKLNAPALVLFATGGAKRVQPRWYEHGQLLRMMFGVATAMAIARDDRVLVSAPFHHRAGALAVLGAALLNGACCVLPPDTASIDLLAEIAHHECTLVLLDDAVCARLMSSPVVPGERDHGLRAGAGTLRDGALTHGFQQRFGVPEMFAIDDGGVDAASLCQLVAGGGHIMPL